MHEDQVAGPDLTSDADRCHHPTPAAEITCAHTTRSANDNFDLADREDPSDAANVTVHSTPNMEQANLSLSLGSLLRFSYCGHGPAAWASTLGVVVSALAVVAAMATPWYVLPAAAGTPTRVAVAAFTAAIVLAAGLLVPLLWFRRKD